MNVERYERLDGGFRMRPDGRGGLAHLKTGNDALRSIPASDRMLSVLCFAAGSRHQGRLVGIVTFDWQVHITANPNATVDPGLLYTQCRCGPAGHTLELAKLVAAAHRLRYQPAKSRRVDVLTVAV